MPPSNRVDYPALALLTISALGFTGALISATSFGMMGLINLLLGEMQVEGLLPLFSFAWVGIFLGLMVLPGLAISFSRLTGINLPTWKGLAGVKAANWLMVIWPLVVLSGQLVSRAPGLVWLFLPPLQLLAVGIPIFWFVETGRRKIGVHRPGRDWGFISAGVVVIPLLVLMAELALLGLAAAGFLVWAGRQPGLLQQITRLGQEVMNSPMDTAVLENAVSTLAGSSWFVVMLLTITAALVPLIEELLKPAALWLLAGKNLTPAEGFEAGLICGATFAFLESMGLFGTPFSGEWSVVVLARLGTGLLHSLASGLAGWAIVSAWCDRRLIRAGFLYLAAVFLHGLWNIFAVSYGFTAYIPEGSGGWSGILYQVGRIAPYTLPGLSVVMFISLILINRRLRLHSVQSAQI